MASRRSPIAGTSRFRGGIRALEHARTRPHTPAQQPRCRMQRYLASFQMWFQRSFP